MQDAISHQGCPVQTQCRPDARLLARPQRQSRRHRGRETCCLRSCNHSCQGCLSLDPVMLCKPDLHSSNVLMCQRSWHQSLLLCAVSQWKPMVQRLSWVMMLRAARGCSLQANCTAAVMIRPARPSLLGGQPAMPAWCVTLNPSLLQAAALWCMQLSGQTMSVLWSPAWAWPRALATM